VFITNLDDNLTEQMVYNTFSKYGPIFSVKIMRHMITKQSRGFGYVNFRTPQSAQRAIA
jgi:RNA recognition motif-containing protein